MTVESASFDDLDIRTLYGILRLRSEVFVVEQNCVYQDIDDLDVHSWHVWQTENGRVVACARLFEKDVDSKTIQIGRVVVAENYRREGRASVVMEKAIDVAKRDFGAKRLYLEAQTYAIDFYKQFGFEVCSDEFLEDGIPHVKMERISL